VGRRLFRTSNGARRAVVVVALFLAACDRSAPDAPVAAAPTEYMAVGVFNSADAQAGTVNISHQPVPSAGWPAMTMDFKLGDKAAVDELKPGDRVDIHFTIESGMNATVSSITPIH